MTLTQSAQAVAMNSNDPEAAPAPIVLPLGLVVVAAPQMPVGPHANPPPTRIIVSSQDAQAIQMSPNSPEFTPDPTRSHKGVVFAPQMPVRSHAPPVALVITIQSSESVSVALTIAS